MQHKNKDTGFAHIASMKPPVLLMKHSLASTSTVADIMVKKYIDGLALALQEKIWAREGVKLSRATHGQLGDPVQWSLAEALVQAHEYQPYFAVPPSGGSKMAIKC